MLQNNPAIGALLMLGAVGCFLVALVKRRSSRSDIRRLALIFCWSSVLILALRFGGRTYPGLHFPDSPTLNQLLNGSWIFVGLGYDLVLVAIIAASLQLIQLPSSRGATALAIVKWAAIALAITIALLGVLTAWVLHRMPWENS